MKRLMVATLVVIVAAALGLGGWQLGAQRSTLNSQAAQINRLEAQLRTQAAWQATP